MTHLLNIQRGADNQLATMPHLEFTYNNNRQGRSLGAVSIC